MRDRRRYIRIPVKVEFSVREGKNDEFGELFFSATNVSRGGAFLASDLLFDLETHLHISFELPGGIRIETGAIVVWTSDGEDGEPGMGVSFTTLRPEYLAAINTFVNENYEAAAGQG